MQPGTVIASRYRILRELGRGGMGVVYAVQHLNTGETLALKLLLAHSGSQAEILERFKREMRAPALIKSEHVVRVTDADIAPELDGALFLVMELLTGRDLEQLLRTRGLFSPVETVWLLGQAARALDKAHAAGIVHRDLKPENLFVHRRDEQGYIVKLLDFGVAHLKHREASTSELKVTKSGDILGTPMYLSPEQAMGDSDELGPHSDVWSIGLIAFELLVGHTYFEADSVTKLIGQICFQPLPLASQRGSTLGPAFDRWFERSCVRDAKARWPSVGAQVAALAETLGIPAQMLQSAEPPASLVSALRTGTEVAASEAGPAREARTTTSEGRGQSAIRSGARRWLLGGAAVLLALAVLGLGGLVGRLRSGSRASGQSSPTVTAAGTATTVSVDAGAGSVVAPPSVDSESPKVASPPSRSTVRKSEPAHPARKKPASGGKPASKRPAHSTYDPVAP